MTGIEDENHNETKNLFVHCIHFFKTIHSRHIQITHRTTKETITTYISFIIFIHIREKAEEWWIHGLERNFNLIGSILVVSQQ